MAGCATLAICSAVGYVPIIGWYCLGPLSLLLTPALVGVVTTSVGDLAGQTRGAILWPVLGAYAAELGGTLLTVAAATGTFVALGGGTLALFGDRPDLENLGHFITALLTTYSAAAVVALAGSVLTLVATVITPVVIYAMMSDFKQPGDEEFRFPGLLTPAHAEPSAPASASQHGEAPSLAMAY